MSLRWRLLLFVVLLNLAVVGIVQIGSLWLHRERSKLQQEVYHRLLRTVLADAYPDRPERVEYRWVRELLDMKGFPATVFRDVMVSTGAPAGTAGFVDLNPMGAAHRRSQDFSLDDVRAGIRRAKLERSSVPVGEGFCVPLEVGGATSELGAWYVPIELPSAMPLAFFVVPVLLSTAVIGVLAFYSIGVSVVRPLERVGRAAAQVGAGEGSVRVERVASAPELNVLIDAFNSMAARVAGHTDELRCEVQRATEEAARRERAMVVSSRLAAMGTLAAGIAHEINNPIGGMINAVHRLSQRDDLDERSAKYLQVIRGGLERVGAIARRVLDFSPRQIEAAPFRIADAVEGARILVEHRSAYQGVELRVDLPSDLPDVAGDRHELQQVLLNCLLNSLDVLEDRGRSQGAERDWIVVSARLGNGAGWVLLDIDDNGPGTDEETLARVMDPFFSAKGDPGASGLGLFISYSIIKNHGGEMEVDSAPGKGFHVHLRLPVAAPATD